MIVIMVWFLFVAKVSLAWKVSAFVLYALGIVLRTNVALTKVANYR